MLPKMMKISVIDIEQSRSGIDAMVISFVSLERKLPEPVITVDAIRLLYVRIAVTVIAVIWSYAARVTASVAVHSMQWWRLLEWK